MEHLSKPEVFADFINVGYFHGKKEYDGGISLHDMLDLEGENHIFKDYVADYKMNLITLDDFEEEKCESVLRELAVF